MYKRQKGILPLITHILGLIILVYPTFVILFYSIPSIFRSNGIESIAMLFASILVLIFPISIGGLMLFLFPRLKISNDGIRYMSSLITTRLLRWEDIDFLHEFKNGYGAIVINPKNFKGSYIFTINKIYGLITGIIDPIILLSPETLNIIQKNIRKLN